MRASTYNASLAVMVGFLALSSTSCVTSGAVPVPRPFPGGPVAIAAPIAPDAPDAPIAPVAPVAPDLRVHRFDGRAVAQFALGFRGVPYRPGGADPAGFDCSGLVQYVFSQYGVSVPRVVEEQYAVGDKIKPSKIQPGDLIFFNTTKRGSNASHVAIAIGPHTFVHAPNSTGVVRVETLDSSYWGARYIGARRITPSTASN